MAYIRLPDNSYYVAPDGTSYKEMLDQAQRKYPQIFGIEKTVGGYAKESLKGIVPGAIGLGETAVAGLASLLPEEQEKAVRGKVGEWATAAKKPFRAAPGYDDIFGRQIGEGLGSTLPFFVLGPAGIAGRVGAGVLAGAAGAGEARQEAEQSKATPEQKSTATALGVLPGLLDIVAPEVGHLVSKVIPRALLQGGVEGATEAAQKIAQNAIAKGLYNPEQPLLKDAAAEGGVGAVVGTLASLLMAPFMKQKGGAGANIKPPATEEEVLAHRKALEDEEKRLVEERRQAQYAARIEKEFQRRLPGAKEAYDEQVRKAQAGIAPGTQLSLDQTIQPFDEERVRAEAKEAVDRKVAKKLGLPYVSPSQKAAAEEPEDEARARYEYEQLSSLKQQVMGTMQDASDNGDEAGYQKAQATYAQLVDPKGRLAKLEKQFGSDELPLLSVEAAQKKLAALEEKIEATKGRFESIDKLLEQRARAQKQLQQAHSAQTAAAAQAQQGAAPAEAEQVDLFKDLEQRDAQRQAESSKGWPQHETELRRAGLEKTVGDESWVNDLLDQQQELTGESARNISRRQTQEQLEEMRRQSAQMQLPLERGQGAVPPIPAGVAIANRLNQRQGEVAAVEERLAEAQKALETAQPWQKEPLSRQVSLLQEELAHRKQQLANTQRQNALFEKFHEGKRGVKPFNPLAQVAPAAPVGTSRPNAAHVAVTEQAQRVENALFEFGETIDRLRSDVDSGRPVQLDQEKARGLINEIVDATFQHVAAQRQLNGLPPADQAKLNTAELMMRSRLEGMLSIAPMRRVLEQQRPGAVAEEASLASARAEVAKSYGFTPEQLLEAEKQNPDLRKEVGQRMVPALARAKAQREKQGEIRHGMTRTQPGEHKLNLKQRTSARGAEADIKAALRQAKASRGDSEFVDVQNFVQRIRKALQGKKEAPAATEAKKRTRVPGPRTRTAEMYERAREMAYERQRTEQRKDTLAKQTLRTARLAKVAEGRLKQLKKRLYERGALDKEGSSYRGGLRALRSERFKYLRQIDELTTAMFHSITSSMVERAHKNMLAAIKPFLRNGAVRSAYDKFLEAQKSVAEWHPKVLKSADYLGFINSEEVFDALGYSKGYRNPQGAAWKRQHEEALNAALARTGRPARFSAPPQNEHDLEVLKATEVLAAIEANKKELTEQHDALKKALDDASAQLRRAVRAVKGEGENAVGKDVSDQIDVIGKDYEALLDSPKIDLPLSEELLLNFVVRQQEQALEAFENIEATNKLLSEQKALATAKAEAERLTEQIDAFTFTIESLTNPEQPAPRIVGEELKLPAPKPIKTQPTAQSVAAAADANVPTSRRVEHPLAQVLPHQVSTRALNERKATIAKLRSEIAELGRKVGLHPEEFEDTQAEPRPGRGKAEVSDTRVKDNKTRLKKIEKLRIEEEGLANAEEALAQHPELTETADAIERVRARIYKIAPQLGLNPESALDPDNAPIPEYTRTKRQQQLERRRLFLAQNFVELQDQMTVPLRRTRRFVAPQTESTQEEAMEAWDRQREGVQERVARGLEKQRKALVLLAHTQEFNLNEAQAFSAERKARRRVVDELTEKRDELRAQLEEAHNKATVKAELDSVQAQLQAQRKLAQKANVGAKKTALTRTLKRLESIEARAKKLGVELVPRQDSLKAALEGRDLAVGAPNTPNPVKESGSGEVKLVTDTALERQAVAADLKTGVLKEAKKPKGARVNIGTKATEARLAAEEERNPRYREMADRMAARRIDEAERFEAEQELSAGLGIGSDSKFRTSQRPATPVAAAEAQSVVDRVKAKLPAHITFNFYPTLEEARAAHPEMAGAEAGGAVLPDGTVVVVGDMHADVAGLEETIAHELVGHYGVDAILGKDGMGDISGELWARGAEHVAEVAYGLGSFPTLGDARLAVAHVLGKKALGEKVNAGRRKFLKTAASAAALPKIPFLSSGSSGPVTVEKFWETLRWADEAYANFIVQVEGVVEGALGGDAAYSKLGSTSMDYASDLFNAAAEKVFGSDRANDGNLFQRIAYEAEFLENPVAIDELVEELISEYGDKLPDMIKEVYAEGSRNVVSKAAKLLAESGTRAESAPTTQSEDQQEQAKLIFTSEMIARSAEPLRVHPTFAQQVVGFVKGWLRRLKQLFSNWNLSSQAKKDIKEIQKLVQEAHATFGETRQGVHRTSTGQIQFRTNTAPPPAGVKQLTWDAAQGLVYKKPGKWASIKANLWGIQGVTQFVDNHAATIKAMTMGRDMGLITEQELSQALYWLRMYNKNANLTRLVAARGPLHIAKVDNGRSFMVEPKGGADAPTLEKAFKALAESGWSEAQLRTGATMYLAAKRVLNSGGRITPDMLHFGKNPDGSPVLTEALLRDFVAGVDSDPKAKAAFDKFRNIYNEYNKGLVSFLAESGFLSKEEAAALAKTNDYVPYYRPTPTGELQLFISGEKSPIMLGNLKDHKDLKHLVGGDTPILDLFTSALQNTHMMTTLAMRNIAARNTAYMMKHLGLSANRSRSGAIRHVAPHSGKQLSGPNTIHFRHNYTDNNGQEKHTDAVIEISTKGTAFEGIPTELIITGLEGIKTTYPKLLEALGAPSKFLRRMVILNPIYPLRQLVKDSVSSWGISGANYKPIVDPARNMLQAAFGKQSATMNTMEARGLVGGQLLSASNEEQMATVLRELSTNSKSPTAFLAKVEAKYMQVDAATREAAYNSFRAQGLSELDTWIATNELMDFNKRGTSSAVFVLNNLIPFFNAQIQGLNVFARAATGRMPSNKQLKVSTKFYTRGLSLAALTMMYAALMGDDDAYKNATPEQRLRNWFIPTPFTDEPVKVPIPFEYGLVFKAIPEALFTVFTDKDADGKAILKGLGSVAGQSVPGGIPPVPQFAKPAIEALTGIDLYTLRPIESAQERKMEPFMRVRDNTSGVAEALGKAMNVSPVMVDHLLQTIGGPLAASMATASSLFSDRPPSASYKTSQMPVVGTLFQATDAGGIINEVYDTALKALESQATYKQMAETGDERAEEYGKQHENMLAIAQSAGSFKQKMGELTKYERSIRTDRGMSPKDKREQLDEVRRLKIDTAKAYREVFRQASGT